MAKSLTGDLYESEFGEQLTPEEAKLRQQAEKAKALGYPSLEKEFEAKLAAMRKKGGK